MSENTFKSDHVFDGKVQIERMTTVERGLASKDVGRVVYDTDLNKIYYGNGSSWVEMGVTPDVMLKSVYDVGDDGAVDMAEGLKESGGQDLDMGAVADGEVLVRSGTNITSIPAAGAGAHALDGHTDVSAGSPSYGDALMWTGSAWVNGSFGNWGLQIVYERLSPAPSWDKPAIPGSGDVDQHTFDSGDVPNIDNVLMF